MKRFIKYFRYGNYRTVIKVPAAFSPFYNAIPKDHRLNSDYLNSHYCYLCYIFWEDLDLIREMLKNSQTSILHMQSTKQGMCGVAKFLIKNVGRSFELIDGLKHD